MRKKYCNKGNESLAEFAARRRQKIKIIFHRDMCVGKNTSQAASVEFLHIVQKLCAQQTAIPLSKIPKEFSTVYIVCKAGMRAEARAK